MIIRVLSFLLIFSFYAMISFATVSKTELEAQLQDEFSADLMHVPFFLRFSFYNQFHKDWQESSYLERQNFLLDYKRTVTSNQTDQTALLKAQVAEFKEQERAKKEAERQEKDRLKAQKAEKKAEERALKERQKEFDDSVKAQKKELQEMLRESKHGG